MTLGASRWVHPRRRAAGRQGAGRHGGLPLRMIFVEIILMNASMRTLVHGVRRTSAPCRRPARQHNRRQERDQPEAGNPYPQAE